MRRWIAILLILTVPACTSDSRSPLATASIDSLPGGATRVTSAGATAWHDTTGWRFVAEGRIGGEPGTPGEIINPMMLDVDDEGRVFVVDQSPAAIKVFGPDGSLVRLIGRQGEGPGEYRAPFIALRGSRLAVHDPRLSRTSLFDTSGAFIRSWASACCYWTQPGFDRSGRIVIPLMSADAGTSVRYIRFDTLGRALDTLTVPQFREPKTWVVEEKGVRKMMVTVPLTPATVHELHPEGGLVIGWSGAYEVIRSRTGRDTAMVFTRVWTPRPVDAGRRRALIDGMIEQQRGDVARETLERIYRLGDVPTTLPAYNSFLLDQSDNTWVVTDSDSTRTELDVFAATGAFLGSVVAPFRVTGYSPAAWGRDALHVVGECDDGNPCVLRYRLVKETAELN